jgi:hypothetical protein
MSKPGGLSIPPGRELHVPSRQGKDQPVEDKPEDRPPTSLPSPETPQVHDLIAESLTGGSPEIGAPALGKVLAAEPLTTRSPEAFKQPPRPVHHLELPESLPPDDASPAKLPAKPSRKRGSHYAPQRLRARKVLRRIWPGDYPSRDEVTDADLWDQFCVEYDHVEGKAEAAAIAPGKPTSKYGRPSKDTLLRLVGRKD